MSSPFASQLGTNYCPPDTELTQIKALLVEPCLRLKHLDAEIAVMRKALDKLTEERDALGAYVDAHKTLLSPVRRLPLDIIEEIFMACLPSHRNCVMSAQEAPVILGRICSSWRALSLSTPRLWSRLHIVEPSYPYSSSYTSADGLLQVKTAQRLEVANAWLRRSGTCPLSISLESSHDHSITPPLTPPLTPSSTPSPDVFLNSLISFASQWQTISLVIPPFTVQPLLRLTEDDVPLLKSLTINERPGNPHHDTNTQLNITQARVLHAPTISTFSLTGGHAHSSDLPLRWSNLISLTLMGPAWDAANAQTCQVILDILSRCSQLRTCAFLVNEPPDGSMQNTTVACPFLHSLDMMCFLSPLRTLGLLLSRLLVPNLKDLKLRGEGQPHNASEADFLVSALAASTGLESISISSEIFSTPCLMEFLRSLPPTVQRLHIAEPWRVPFSQVVFDNDVLIELEASPLLPALEELVITDCREVSDDALLRFIISRMPTLKRVDIKFDRERQIDILPSLQSFLEAGAQIFVAYIAPSTQFSPWMGLPDASLFLPAFEGH
ncbi:hypothetical protein K438DRAFT_1759068 [Mycena galopus ATCC 62051]|nr:hypothetical protein K438DRAFT_1759068 [Mycena galopus ATCC 62051]